MGLRAHCQLDLASGCKGTCVCESTDALLLAWQLHGWAGCFACSMGLLVAWLGGWLLGALVHQLIAGLLECSMGYIYIVACMVWRLAAWCVSW
jgi:Na+-driven multidrug efflux pump